MSNPIVHFEIAGADEGALHTFYAELFRWEIKPMGPGYALVETPDGSPNGALREAEQPELNIGIGVLDLARSLEIASAAGGTVVMPATDNGYVNKAQISDPAGNLITLIENSESKV